MLDILQTRSQIDSARTHMDAMGISTLESSWQRVARKLKLASHLPVGDRIKSWDVLSSIQFLQKNVSLSAPILDIGAYCSEVPVSLARLGFTGVHAIDLNPDIKKMPENDKVNYEIGNFLQTNYSNQKFQAITAISVIEHGYQPEALFKETSRLLQSGGYFIASFDYWAKKIDVGNTRFFDMSWLLFSKEDVQEMLRVATNYGLEPVGDLNFNTHEKPIHCLGFDYTFAWLVLRKK